MFFKNFNKFCLIVAKKKIKNSKKSVFFLSNDYLNKNTLTNWKFSEKVHFLYISDEFVKQIMKINR